MNKTLGIKLIDEDNNVYEFITNKLYKVNDKIASIFLYYSKGYLYFKDFNMDKEEVYSVLDLND